MTGAKLGYIALTDSAPLIIAKEKGLFAKPACPSQVVKQASWGATRDNMVLGGAANGIDGAPHPDADAHLIRPARYAEQPAAADVDRRPAQLDSQAISVAQEYQDRRRPRRVPLKEAFAKPRRPRARKSRSP